MENKLNRIEGKLDKVVEHISSIDSTLAAQHVQLKEHIRRTELLEADVAPLKKRYHMVSGIVKFFVLLTAGGAGFEGIIAAIKYLKGIQ